MKNRISILLVFAVCAICVLSGCSEKHDGKWINSNLAGTYAKFKPSLKDDFYQAVGWKWLKAHRNVSDEEGRLSFLTDTEDDSDKQIRIMLKESTSLSYEEELCKTFYNQIIDTETRNALGMKAANDIIRQFKDISSFEELWETAYSDTLPDCLPFEYSWLSIDPADTSMYSPEVQVRFVFGTVNQYHDFSDEKNQKLFEAVKKHYADLLVKCGGWKQRDAEKAVGLAFNLERDIAQVSTGSSAYYDRAKFEMTYPNIPLFDILEKKGAHFDSVRIVNEENWRNMNQVLRARYFEQWKMLTMLQFFNVYGFYFDTESLNQLFDMVYGIAEDAAPFSEEDKQIVSLQILKEPLSQAWYKRYVSQDTIDEVTALTKKIISCYEKRFDEADWISEKTRLGAYDKLNNLKYFIGTADMNDWSEFTLYDSSVEGALLKNAIRIMRHLEEISIACASEPVNPDSWSGFTPDTVNACYLPTNNSINIFAGIINLMYKEDWPIEKKLGNLGFVIGHEITHVFDLTGSRWDKYGNNADWWDYHDLAVLEQKSLKLAAPAAVKDVVESGVSMPAFQGEVTADAGGLAVMLDIAKEYPDFDYDLFFRSIAESLLYVYNKRTMDQHIKTDVHPTPFIRVNYTLQRCDEFYETYGITEGDGMYLPPEERFRVW